LFGGFIKTRGIKIRGGDLIGAITSNQSIRIGRRHVGNVRSVATVAEDYVLGLHPFAHIRAISSKAFDSLVQCRLGISKCVSLAVKKGFVLVWFFPVAVRRDLKVWTGTGHLGAGFLPLGHAIVIACVRDTQAFLPQAL